MGIENPDLHNQDEPVSSFLTQELASQGRRQHCEEVRSSVLAHLRELALRPHATGYTFRSLFSSCIVSAAEQNGTRSSICLSAKRDVEANGK